jgi:hypothetical protein
VRTRSRHVDLRSCAAEPNGEYTSSRQVSAQPERRTSGAGYYHLS